MFVQAHCQGVWGLRRTCFLTCSGVSAQIHYRTTCHWQSQIPLTWHTTKYHCMREHHLLSLTSVSSIYCNIEKQPIKYHCILLFKLQFIFLWQQRLFHIDPRLYLKYIINANIPKILKELMYNHVNQSVKVDLQTSNGISSFLTIHVITIDQISAKDNSVTTGLNLSSPKNGMVNCTHKLWSL